MHSLLLEKERGSGEKGIEVSTYESDGGLSGGKDFNNMWVGGQQFSLKQSLTPITETELSWGVTCVSAPSFRIDTRKDSLLPNPCHPLLGMPNPSLYSTPSPLSLPPQQTPMQFHLSPSNELRRFQRQLL